MRLVEELRRFRSTDGAVTEIAEDGGLPYFINSFWTAGQRQGHSLHEVSYRACFKAQLPGFFIERLTAPGETVFDPFAGRGTTPLQAALMGRRAVANDVNPLSAMLLRPRLAPPGPNAVARRLAALDLAAAPEPAADDELLVFFHSRTLRALYALRAALVDGDTVDDWIRMVALNRLTGHSPGFFSVYTLPPNQAVSLASQRKINADRAQVPPYRDVVKLILRKTMRLLADGAPPAGPAPVLMTGPADATPGLRDHEVDLIVTSPPFLDVVDYAGDNWLRCWFAGIDPSGVAIAHHRGIAQWEGFVRRCFTEFARVVRPGGTVAFEVGEVRGGRVLLERHVVAALEGLPFAVDGVMVNRQSFTKTANIWRVDNNRRGTNSNRIVLARRLASG